MMVNTNIKQQKKRPCPITHNAAGNARLKEIVNIKGKGNESMPLIPRLPMSQI